MRRDNGSLGAAAKRDKPGKNPLETNAPTHWLAIMRD
jgi:hypothetical protein